MANVKIQYFQPLEKKMTDLQIVKANCRSYKETNKNNIPINTEEVQKMSNRNHALKYLNMKTNNEIKTKTEYCKRYHISSNTLNRGLEILGSKVSATRGKGRTKTNENMNQTESNKIKQDKKKHTGGLAFGEIDREKF